MRKLKKLREFDHKGFHVALGRRDLSPVQAAAAEDDGIDLSELDDLAVCGVTLLTWTVNGGARRDVSRELLGSDDLDAWQANTKAYIDGLLDKMGVADAWQ